MTAAVRELARVVRPGGRLAITTWGPNFLEPGSTASPQAWWSAVLGTGHRGTLEQLDAHAREQVRAANLDFVRSSGLSSVEANVVYAIGTKA